MIAFKDFSKNSFSVLHLNIRSINKNFEAFTEFYSKLNHIFSAICFPQTWASEKNINKNSTYQLKNYNVIHQVRNSCKVGGSCIFINESFCYKLRKNLSINSEAIELFPTEISGILYKGEPNPDLDLQKNRTPDPIPKLTV